jgi:hypothetical protein
VTVAVCSPFIRRTSSSSSSWLLLGAGRGLRGLNELAIWSLLVNRVRFEGRSGKRQWAAPSTVLSDFRSFASGRQLLYQQPLVLSFPYEFKQNITGKWHDHSPK